MLVPAACTHISHAISHAAHTVAFLCAWRMAPLQVQRDELGNITNAVMRLGPGSGRRSVSVGRTTPSPRAQAILSAVPHITDAVNTLMHSEECNHHTSPLYRSSAVIFPNLPCSAGLCGFLGHVQQLGLHSISICSMPQPLLITPLLAMATTTNRPTNRRLSLRSFLFQSRERRTCTLRCFIAAVIPRLSLFTGYAPWMRERVLW